MAEIQGTATNVRIEQEGNRVVLRFILEAGGERIPVEMRGRKVSGVLDSSNEVRLFVRGGKLRDRDGIARPHRIEIMDTRSVVRVRRGSCLGNAVGFVFSVILSIGTGAVSESLVEWVMRGFEEPEVVMYSFEEGPAAVPIAAVEEPVLIIPILIGMAVAFLVFFLVYVRPRLRQR